MAFSRDPDKPRRSWARRALITFNVVLATVLVLGASLVGYSKWRFGDVRKLDLGITSRGSGEPSNVLLVGSDTREELGPGEAKMFGSKTKVTGKRSDTIMVLHVDPKTRRAAILSLPRDLWITNPEGGKGRINTTFETSPKNLITTIQNNFGIQIDHYAEVNFDGFRGIVDAMGGVQINFPSQVRDRVTQFRAPAGCVNLKGNDALAYVRSREYEVYEGGRFRPDPRSDLSRIDRQQDFIRRVIRKAVDKGSTNPLTLNALVATGTKNLTVDEGFKLGEITKLAKRFQSLDPNNVEMMVMPTKQANIGGAAVLLPKEPEARQTIDRFLKGAPQTRANEPPPPVPAGSISVRVLNGSGQDGQATETAAKLKDVGFVVAGLGDAKSTAVTTIRYGTGQKLKADVIAKYLNGETQVTQDSSVRGTDAIITLGQSFSGVNTPGQAPTTAPPQQTSTTVKTPFVPGTTTSC